MKVFNKKLIIPIITVLALLIKTVFKIDIPDAAIDVAADIVLYLITLAGLFLHPHVEPEAETIGGQTDVNTQPTSIIENNK